MTDKVKLLAPQIWDQIQKSQNILLHCHPSPDGDSIGSVLALFHTLTALNKNPTVIMGDSEPPKNLAHLPGFNQIIQKNYFQINPSDYDLFIIVDSSDVKQISKKDDIVFPDSLNTIVIDHHITNAGFAKLNLVDSSYVATSQIIYDLIKIWNIPISPATAICLYMGIYTDSGGFKYEPTNTDTLLAGAELVKVYPDFSKEVFIYENRSEPQQLAYLGLALNSIKQYFSGKVAMSVISYSELKRFGIEKKHTEKMEISNYLKSVVGWDIGIAVTEVTPNEINASFRTRDSDKYNVGEIAQKTGFGGGHKSAAGATIKTSLDEAVKLLLDTIAKTNPELGSPGNAIL